MGLRFPRRAQRREGQERRQAERRDEAVHEEDLSNRGLMGRARQSRPQGNNRKNGAAITALWASFSNEVWRPANGPAEPGLATPPVMRFRRDRRMSRSDVEAERRAAVR